MEATSDTPYILAPYNGRQPESPTWLQSALKQTPEQQFFKSDGIDIELLTWGKSDKPGLLFLHGNSAHAHWWSHVAPFFAEHWHCAALSWSGMGNSSRRSNGYTPQILAREALAAIDAAGMRDNGHKPILIGHSMGGMIGMLAASDPTADLGGLIVVDSPIAIDPAQLQSIRVRAPKARNEHMTFASYNEGLARFRLSPPQSCANDSIIDHIARHSLHRVEGGWQWHFDPRKVRIELGQTATAAKQIHYPMAYIYGEQSALVNANSLADSIKQLPPSTPVIGIPGAQHCIMIDQPIALISALRALLSTWPVR